MSRAASPRGERYDRLLLLAKPCDPIPGNPDAFAACILPERVCTVAYDPQTASLSDLLQEVKAKLGDGKVRSLGLLLPTLNRDKNSDSDALWICGKRDESNLEAGGVISAQSINGNNQEVKDFIRGIASFVHSWGRIHILSPFILPRGEALVQALRDFSGLSVAAGKGPTYKNRFVLQAEDGDDTTAAAGLYFAKAYLDRWVADPETVPNKAAPVGDKRADILKHKFKEAAANADNMERIQTIAAVVPFLYSVMVASFLSIFVQQRCPANPKRGYYNVHTCDFYENTHDLSSYNKAVLAINSITCFVLLVGQYMYAKREWWCIEHLDADPREPYDALAATTNFREGYPVLHRQLRTINRHAFIISVVSMAFLAGNFVMSAILVLRGLPDGFYDGPRTATGLITNTLLVLMQIKNAATVCFSSWRNEMAVSTKAAIPKSFNVVDKDMELLRVQQEAEADAANSALAAAPVSSVTVV